MMSISDPEPAKPPLAPSASRRLPVWIGGVAVVLAIATFAIFSGVARWMLAAIGVVLALDMISGLHLFTDIVICRILLPLVITIAVVPFSLIWPGDPGTSHWSTVRARFRSLGRMWLGYWDLDHG